MEETIIPKLEELFNRFESKIYNLHMMDHITELIAKLDVNYPFSMSIYQRSADAFITAMKETDYRILRSYLPLFKAIFMRTDDPEGAMLYFYNLEHFKSSPEKIPAVREKYPQVEYDREANKAIKKLLDLQLAYDEEQFQQNYREFSFYLTLAPKPAIRLVFHSAILSNNVEVLDILIKALRSVPPFFSLRVQHQYNLQKNELLIVTLFRQLICTDFRNQGHKLNAIKHLATELTCTQNSVDELNEIPPVFDANDFVTDLIIDLIERVKDQTINILVEMLVLMLSVAESNKKWRIVWKKPENDSESGIVDPQSLHNAVYDLYKRDLQMKKPVKHIVLVYEKLYKRLKDDIYFMSDFEEEIFVNFLKDQEEKEQREERKRIEEEQEQQEELERIQREERERIEREEREQREEKEKKERERIAEEEKRRLLELEEKKRKEKEKKRLEKEEKEREEERVRQETARLDKEEKQRLEPERLKTEHRRIKKESLRGPEKPVLIEGEDNQPKQKENKPVQEVDQWGDNQSDGIVWGEEPVIDHGKKQTTTTDEPQKQANNVHKPAGEIPTFGGFGSSNRLRGRGGNGSFGMSRRTAPTSVRPIREKPSKQERPMKFHSASPPQY